jgi:hypothetical protein
LGIKKHGLPNPFTGVKQAFSAAIHFDAFWCAVHSEAELKCDCTQQAPFELFGSLREHARRTAQFHCGELTTTRCVNT